MGNLKAVTDTNEFDVVSNVAWEHGRIYFLKSDQDEGDELSVTVTFNDKEKYSDTNGVVDLNLPKVTETNGEFLYTFPSDLIESFGGATPTPIPEQHWMQMDSAELQWSDGGSGYVILKNVTIKNPDWLVGYNGNPEYHIVRKSYFTSGGNIKDLRDNWDSFVMFGYSSTLLGYSNNAIDSSTNLGVNAHYIDSDKFTNNADYALPFYGTQQDTTYNTFTSWLGTTSTELVLAICGINYNDSNTTGEILIDLNVTAPSDPEPTPTPIPQPDSGSNDGSDSSFDVSWATNSYIQVHEATYPMSSTPITELVGRFDYTSFNDNNGTYEYVYKNSSSGWVLLIETYSTSDSDPAPHDFRTKDYMSTYLTIYENESDMASYDMYDNQPMTSNFAIRHGQTFWPGMQSASFGFTWYQY